MLILNRRVNQAIKIGDNVKIVVVGNHQGNVLLGIEAPQEVHIIRTELCKKGGRYERRCKHST